MANHVSAIKRHRQSEKQRIRNRSVKSALSTKIKRMRFDASVDNLRFVQSAYASAVRKGVLHKKTASRKISRIMKNFNQNLA